VLLALAAQLWHFLPEGIVTQQLTGIEGSANVGDKLH